MKRFQRILGGCALCGWLLAAVSQGRSLRASNTTDRSRWIVRRNRWLLFSSVCANTLVASVLYRRATRCTAGRRDVEGVDGAGS